MTSTAVARPYNPLLPGLAVAVCGALWGFFWYPLHWLTGLGVGGAWVSLIFNAVALFTPLPWLLRRAAWKEFPHQAVNGLLLGAAFSLYTLSLVMTDVIHAILLFYLTPLWSTIGAWLLLGEPLTGPRLAAIGVGFSGMALILGGGMALPVPHNAGDWIALISGLLWSAGSMRSYARPATSIPMPVLCFAGGGFVSAAVILVLTAVMAPALAEPGAVLPNLPSIVVLALVMFVPPNFLVLWASQRIDPGRVGILLMTEVLAGAISSALLSGEPFGWRELTGTAMIVCAGLVEVLGRRV